MSLEKEQVAFENVCSSRRIPGESRLPVQEVLFLCELRSWRSTVAAFPSGLPNHGAPSGLKKRSRDSRKPSQASQMPPVLLAGVLLSVKKGRGMVSCPAVLGDEPADRTQTQEENCAKSTVGRTRKTQTISPTVSSTSRKEKSSFMKT